MTRSDETGRVAEPERSQMAEAVISGIPDAIVYADHDGFIRFWNAGAMRIFGFTAEDAIGQSLDIIIPERLRERHWTAYRIMMASGRSRHAEHELLSVPAITRDGSSLSIQFTVAPVHGERGAVAGIVAVMRDITQTFLELKRLRAARS